MIYSDFCLNLLFFELSFLLHFWNALNNMYGENPKKHKKRYWTRLRKQLNWLSIDGGNLFQKWGVRRMNPPFVYVAEAGGAVTTRIRLQFMRHYFRLRGHSHILVYCFSPGWTSGLGRTLSFFFLSEYWRQLPTQPHCSYIEGRVSPTDHWSRI